MRSKLTYSNVMSTLALFIALGGSAAAGTVLIRSTNQIRSGVVNSRVVHNNSITSRDVKNRSLTGVDVRDGSLGKNDFKAGQLPQGLQGLQGPQGQQGERGGSAADSNLVKGQSLRGVTRFRGQSDEAVNVQFQVPLEPSASMQSVVRGVGAAKNDQCPGTADSPEAAPGFLCVYKKFETDVDSMAVENPLTGATGAPWRYGFALEFGVSGGTPEGGYSWAVTAP